MMLPLVCPAFIPNRDLKAAFLTYCQTPDQTKIKIQSNQKSGEALYLGSCLFVRSLFVCRNAGYNRLIPF